jgi:hypothetical protein
MVKQYSMPYIFSAYLRGWLRHLANYRTFLSSLSMVKTSRSFNLLVSNLFNLYPLHQNERVFINIHYRIHTESFNMV